MLVLLNQRRSEGANCGEAHYSAVPALAMNANLRLAARRHSQDMGAQNYFSHTSQDGRTFLERIREAGYAGSCPCGENIAAGGATAETTVNRLMNSPGHCHNIMFPDFRTIGLGYAYDAASTYRHYWTQDFGGR